MENSDLVRPFQNNEHDDGCEADYRNYDDGDGHDDDYVAYEHADDQHDDDEDDACHIFTV